MEYDFTAPVDGPAKVIVYCIPTHALNPGMKSEYSARSTAACFLTKSCSNSAEGSHPIPVHRNTGPITLKMSMKFHHLFPHALDGCILMISARLATEDLSRVTLALN